MSPAVSSQPPLFIVTSGRSGSTFLARALHEHPDLTVISDLFEPVGAMPYLDRGAPVSGAEFWGLLSAPSHPERVRYWRSQPTEELLHLPTADRDVSLLNCYTLPFLTAGDPTALATELEGVVSGFAPAPAPDQLVRCFGWLRDRFGGRRWVERTGGSLPHAGALVACFGDRGKFVHLHRDPAEVALSMMTGSFFRLYLELTRDPELTRWDWCRAPEVTDMARLVERWELDALAAFATLDPGRHHPVSFERLTDQPQAVLLDLLEFLLDRTITAPDVDWAHRQARRVRPAPSRSAALTVAQRRDLSEACAGARSALGYR